MSEEVKKSEEIEISIMDLVKAVISRIWMVALSFLVFVLLVVVYLLNATPVYEVTERIMVQSSEKSSDLSSLLSLSGQSTDIQNDIEILTSKSTFQMALDSLDLDNYVSENGEKYSELDIKVEDLRLGVNISVVEDTNFVEISFKHSNPAFAEDFVSALVEQFSNRMLEMSKSSAYSQLDFIESVRLSDFFEGWLFAGPDCHLFWNIGVEECAMASGNVDVARAFANTNTCHVPEVGLLAEHWLVISENAAGFGETEHEDGTGCGACFFHAFKNHLAVVSKEVGCWHRPVIAIKRHWRK